MSPFSVPPTEPLLATSSVRLLSVSTETEVSEPLKKKKMWEVIQKSGNSLQLLFPPPYKTQATVKLQFGFTPLAKVN